MHPSNIDALTEGQYHFKETSLVSNKNHGSSKHFYLQLFFRCAFCIWVSFLCFFCFFCREFSRIASKQFKDRQNLSYHPMQLIGKNQVLVDSALLEFKIWFRTWAPEWHDNDVVFWLMASTLGFSGESGSCWGKETTFLGGSNLVEWQFLRVYPNFTSEW